MLHIDGSGGEGGGQILRTSLSLSLVTGVPFKMTHIRARRKAPGLMRQHLTAVLAAAEVGQAQVDGAAIGSTELVFSPGKLRGGSFRFAVGTAGSTQLVFQTLLPALLRAPAPSQIEMEGGTHNPMAPPFDFIDQVFLPVLRGMGVEVQASLDSYGFYPAGGGRVRFVVQPCPEPGLLDLRERGAILRCSGSALVAGLPFDIADRELREMEVGLGWPRSSLRPLVIKNSRGPGNALLATLESENLTEMCSAVGERGKPADRVAGEVIEQARAYLAHGAPVGEHLADQLILPMILGKGGVFRTGPLSLHARTQIETVRRFIDRKIEVREVEGAHEVAVG